MIEECIVCFNKKLNKYISFKDRYLIKCDNCGIIFSNDILSKEVDYANKSEYEKYWVDRNEFLNKLSVEYNDFLQKIKKYKLKGEVLEIGCGDGLLLNHFKKQGFGGFGVELSKKDSITAKEKYDLKVINDDFFKIKLKDHFDIIVLWGVIEHINNLNGLIQRVIDISNDNSLLIISTQIEDWLFIPIFKYFNMFFPALGTKFGKLIYDREHKLFFYHKFIVNYLKKNGYKLLYYEDEETLFVKYLYKNHSIILIFIARIIKFLDLLFNTFRKRKYIFQKVK